MKTYLWLASLACAEMLGAIDLDPQTILNQALEKQSNISFSATIISGEGDLKIEQKVVQKKNIDGTVFKRLETRNKLAGESVSLKNSSGTYDIYPEAQKMVKVNFNRADVEPEYSKYTSYNIRRGRISGQNCYIITARISDSPVVFSLFEKTVMRGTPRPLTSAQCKQLFLRAFPAVSVYYIGIDNFFIYSREYYTFDGKLKGRVTYSDIKFDPAIKDSVFDLPVGYSTEYVDNSANFLKITNQIRTGIVDKKIAARHSARKASTGPGVIERFIHWLDFNFEFISSIASKILFWAAMIIIIAVVVIKIKASRK